MKRHCPYYNEDCPKCFPMTKPKETWENRKHKIMQIIYEKSYHAGMTEDLEEGQIIGLKTGKSGELELVSEAIESFIASELQRQREEIVREIEGMKMSETPNVYMGYPKMIGYNRALSDVIERIKNL